MEYSKEDLMEAKKQIWGVGENMGTEESKKIWEENAQFWDNAMGDESNEFHREVVRPKVTELLSPNPADYILTASASWVLPRPTESAMMQPLYFSSLRMAPTTASFWKS